MKNYDVLIIGGGAIGLGIASELKFRQNKLAIAVLDKGEFGKEASWASAGMLEPQLMLHTYSDRDALAKSFFNLCRESQLMFEEFVRRVEWLSGINCEYRKEGILKLLPTGESTDRLMNDFGQWGMRAILWNAHETSDHEPALAEGYKAIHLPDNHQVENRKFAHALEKACIQQEVDLYENAAADSFILNNDAIEAVRIGGEKISAARYVLAAGAWSSQFPELKNFIPEITPIRGQMTCLQMPKPDFIRHAAYQEDFYYVPRNDGRLLVGSTIEESGFVKETSRVIIQGFMQKLKAIIPNSTGFTLESTWAGLRPCSPDKYVALGSTGLSNLSVAIGHFRNGILLTPITAKLMADHLTGQKASPLMTPFSPQRFFL